MKQKILERLGYSNRIERMFGREHRNVCQDDSHVFGVFK